jgi:hypothetical protein
MGYAYNKARGVGVQLHQVVQLVLATQRLSACSANSRDHALRCMFTSNSSARGDGVQLHQVVQLVLATQRLGACSRRDSTVV